MARTVTRTSLDSMDPELGAVRECRGCGEIWPKDAEFFYFDKRWGTPKGECRACWSERRYRPDIYGLRGAA